MPFSWTEPDAPTICKPSIDDAVWTTLASIEQVTSLLINPSKWISILNLKREVGDPKIILLENFVMRFKLRPDAADGLPGDDLKPCIVQGIIDTNVITIRPRIGLGPHIGEFWKDYWDYWADYAALDVVFDHDALQGFGHLELTFKDDPLDRRADKIAAFLMWASDRKQTFKDASGKPSYYLNKILGKKPASAFEIKNRKKNDITGIDRAFRLIDFVDDDNEPCGLEKIQFTLSQNLSDFKIVFRDDDPAVPRACENMAGPIGGTEDDPEIVLDDIVVKNYATPTP